MALHRRLARDALNRRFIYGPLSTSYSSQRPRVKYISIRCTERLAEAGIEPSVGSVGDSYDNAMAEMIFGLFKSEVIWPNGLLRNLEEVEFATLEWVDWFNNRRVVGPIEDVGPIGDIPPAEIKAMYYERLKLPANEARGN